MNYQKISDAYWSPERVLADPERNPSADREAGNAVVDTMTLGDLVEFFSEHSAGPTYCLVKERTIESLAKLPPRLGIKSAREIAERGLERVRTLVSELKKEMTSEL